MVGAPGRVNVVALVAVVTAVVVGVPVGSLALRDGARSVAGPAGAAAASGSRPPARPALLRPVTGRRATSADSALVAWTRRVPCPGRAGPRVSREQVARFAAVAVVTCGREERTIGGAVWDVAVRRVAAAGVPRLLAALRLPSERREGTATCTANLVLLPPLALVDGAGRYVVPPVPVDVCDHPLPEAIRAVNALGWREVSARRLRQVVSPQALAAGCGMKAKNLLEVYGRLGAQRSGSGPVAPSIRRPADVCVFRVTGADREVGSFVRGFSLRPDATRRLLSALTGRAPRGDCPAVRAFAFITLARGPYVQVELGGCWRVERSYPQEAVGTAEPAVAAAVLGRG